MAEEVRPLADFAAGQGRSNQCFLCSIPEREQVEQGKANGISVRIIQDWLEKECGYDKGELHEERLRKHFRGAHHLKGRGNDKEDR